MPTTVSIFSTPAKRRAFQAPPTFGTAERQAHFEPTAEARKYLRTLRTIDNKVSFITQYGYFGAKGRFYEANQFREADIKYIHRLYGFPSSRMPASPAEYPQRYGGASALRHRRKILELKGWKVPGEQDLKRLTQFAGWQAEKQVSPEEMLWILVDHCWAMQWVIPAYEVLSSIISQSHLQFEAGLIEKVRNGLASLHKQKLEELLEVDENNKTLLAKAKRIDQSIKTKSLTRNAGYLALFNDYFFTNETLINRLKLTDSATGYYAHWIMKAKAFQLNQFKDRARAYLYLLAFVKHQFYIRQDAAMKGFLNAVRTSINKASKKADEHERRSNAEKNKAIDAVSDSQKRLTKLVGEIMTTVDDPKLTDARKLEIIRNQVVDVLDSHDDEFTRKSEFLDRYREQERKDLVFISALIEQSRSLSRAVGRTLQLLVFDEQSANPDIWEAIQYYQRHNGRIAGNAPTRFLLKQEKEAVFDDESINAPLYKMFLYRHLVSHIKSGELSLKYGYEYRSLDNYMISPEQWRREAAQLIDDAGLAQYADVKAHLDRLKKLLESAYERVNRNFAKGDNGWLALRPSGRFHVKTPAIDYDQSRYISTLLANDGEIPIMQVLRETDRACQFTELLTHHANRHAVKTITPEIGIAGIMGLGCNIGARRMASKSVGIKSGVLLDAVNWRFSGDNLRKINQRIVGEIESLKLPNIYKVDDDCLLSSSDGKKVTVAVDSLLANYSFKYYGRDKGVAIYSFINERQTLFHSTVFSSSDREAIYLVDGLLHNTAPVKHIHATDTHGYTEAIFAATHLIDIAFAPRFRRIEDQVIYSFHAKEKYKDKDYRILPSRRINRKLIEENWDDILRFMATIKLGRTSASRLFKRLNSYSKDHPLYKALKEFGRILKSLHILNYVDDLEFRQKIQKQLNRVEMSNKFSDAVFWDRGKQFHVGTRDEQEKYTLCKTIIQNAIIFWNYLFLTDRLISCKDPQDRQDMVESIMRGSVLAWRHINFSGEYDFTKPASKHYQFNYAKLKKFKVDKPDNASHPAY